MRPTHFRADAELRGKWVLKGEPALVDSTSPRYGEKASYYSAVCLETGQVEWMEPAGNRNAGTAVAFLMQLREKRPGPLKVIWDNAPARDWSKIWGGDAGVPQDSRSEPAAGEPRIKYGAGSAGLQPRLQRRCGHLGLGEGGGHWQSVPGKQGSRAGAERIGSFLAGPARRKAEVRRRCRTVLQSRAEALWRGSGTGSRSPANAHPTLALV